MLSHDRLHYTSLGLFRAAGILEENHDRFPRRPTPSFFPCRILRSRWRLRSLDVMSACLFASRGFPSRGRDRVGAAGFRDRSFVAYRLGELAVIYSRLSYVTRITPFTRFWFDLAFSVLVFPQPIFLRHVSACVTRVTPINPHCLPGVPPRAMSHRCLNSCYVTLTL